MHIYASLANELLFDFCLHHSKLVLVEIGLIWFSLCFNEVFGWFLHAWTHCGSVYFPRRPWSFCHPFT